MNEQLNTQFLRRFKTTKQISAILRKPSGIIVQTNVKILACEIP